MSKIPEVQEAVRALQGVARAIVRWPEPHGPATLHIEFADGADREAVAGEVLDLLERIGGVDLQSLSMPVPPAPDEVETPPMPRAWQVETQPEQHPNGSEDDTRSRPVFAGLTVNRSDLDNSVTVQLRVAGRTITGTAEGMATRRATLRTAAAAALLALRQVVPHDFRLQLDWLEVVEGVGPDRPDMVHAAVTCLSGEGEETFLGSAMVRDDLREAAVRATLDALNRRLTMLLPAAS